jgi:acyl dehydratase
VSTETTASPVAAKVFFEEVEVGQELPPLTNAPVKHTQLVKYAGASGDFNPLHTDPEVGVKVGVGGPIAHGMLIMGFLGHFVSDYLGGPGGLRRFGVRFQSMTRHDDVITCTGTITKKYEQDGQHFIEASVAAKDQNGDVKASGSFTAALPSRQ